MDRLDETAVVVAVFSDMQLIRDRFHPTLAFLSIGGHFTMDPTGAAQAVEFLGVTDVAPMHYGTFPILAGTPDQLRAALADRRARACRGPCHDTGT